MKEKHMQVTWASGQEKIRLLVISLRTWLVSHPRTLGGCLVLWLTTWLLMWLAVPGWLQPRLEQVLGAQLGRTVHIASVQFRPWSLEMIVNGLDVASADGKTSQLTIARVVVDAELESLLRMAPVIDRLEVDTPQLKLTHLQSGSYDVDDLIKKFSTPSAGGSDKPIEFALYNVSVHGGQIDFDDRVAQRVHHVREFSLGLPFVSNLPSKREVKVQPHLSLVLNGERIDTTVQASPFAADKQAQINLKLPHWDIAPYLMYWPSQWPIKPTQGVLAMDVVLNFDEGQGGHPHQVTLGGRVQLHQWQWAAKALKTKPQEAGVWLKWDKIDLHLQQLEPLQHKLRFSSIDLVGVQASVFKDEAGRWLGWPTQTKQAAPSPDARPWAVVVDRLGLSGTQVRWLIDGASAAHAVVIDDIHLQGQHIRWPAVTTSDQTPSTVAGAFQWPAWVLNGKGLSKKSGTLTFTATGSPQGGTAQVQIQAAQLDNLQAVLPVKWTPELTGLLQGQLMVQWAQGADQMWHVQVKAPSLTLERLSLKSDGLRPASRGGAVSGDMGRPLVTRLRRLHVQDAELHWPAQRLSLPRVLIDEPQIEISRDALGRWMWQQWVGADSMQGASPTPLAVKNKTATWQVQLGELAVQNGHAVWWDAAASGVLTGTATLPAVDTATMPSATARWERGSARLEALAIQATVKDLVFSEQGVGAGLMRYDLKAQVQSMGRSLQRKGQVVVRGTVESKLTGQLPMMTVQSAIDVQRFPLHALEPYAREHVLIALLQADASVKGTVRYQRMGHADAGQLQLLVDASLDDLQANSLNPVQELLSWKSLQLHGVQVRTVTGQPLRVSVSKTRLSDFYARLVISDKGQINLQHLLRQPVDAQASTSTVAVSANLAVTNTAPASIRVDGIELVNGRINFSDYFIHPNYSANLSDLNGSLGAFSTVADPTQVQMADLVLKGKAQGTADLLVKGQLNPLAKPLAMNIKGQVTDLELPPLSPYTAKYLGYAIERGKLNVDLGYEIAPDGQLKASNNFVLSQLTLGEKIEGQGSSLPVKLAISLLKDRKGVIDVNLPVNGSVNDPQFKLGPLVWRLVLTMIGRALTSPFSLIAGALSGEGGDTQAGVIGFDAGSDRMQVSGEERLGGIVKAMTDRPTLKMSLHGHVNAKTEGVAMQQDKLQQLVWAEKQRKIGGANTNQTERKQVSGEEYNVLLKEVYKQSSVKKPRNLIGMAKDISVPEMETLLMAQFPAHDDAMRELGFARSQQVKNALVARGLALERIFLANPKLDAQAAQVQLQVAVD